jgi:hypothetical protein
VVVPQGAMYVMVRVLVDQFSDIANDVDFANMLLAEEAVFVLPGKVRSTLIYWHCFIGAKCEGLPFLIIIIMILSWV